MVQVRVRLAIRALGRAEAARDVGQRPAAVRPENDVREPGGVFVYKMLSIVTVVSVASTMPSHGDPVRSCTAVGAERML